MCGTEKVESFRFMKTFGLNSVMKPINISLVVVRRLGKEKIKPYREVCKAIMDKVDHSCGS